MTSFISRSVGIITVVAIAACGRSGDQASADSAAPSPPPSTTNQMAVTENGVGPVQIGMTTAQVQSALGKTIAIPVGVEVAACRVARWEGAPPGLTLMFEGGRVVRVDVDSASASTAAGAKVGDPETRIGELYAGRVQTTPHKYDPNGHYLTVTPAGSDRLIVFETDGKQVTRFRAGQRPQVEYVERCG